jgi:hypothetical protein
MRTAAALALLALAATPLAAQQAASKPADKPAAAAKADGHAHKADSTNHRAAFDNAPMGVLPEGWSARLDRGTDMSKMKFVVMDPGFHVTLGPAAIFWRAADRANGAFHTVATIHQMKAPAHPEGYGLFYGGQALDGEEQKYTYFLVRGDGTYLVKQRNGAETANVTEGWVEHAAVKKQDAEGKTMNKLEIDATGDQIRFLVNGQQVHTMAAAPGSRNGIVGLRINHNLDLHVEGFEVHAQ